MTRPMRRIDVTQVPVSMRARVMQPEDCVRKYGKT